METIQNDPWSQFLTDGEWELEQQSNEVSPQTDAWDIFLQTDQAMSMQNAEQPQPVQEETDPYASIKEYHQGRDLLGGFRGPIAAAGGVNNMLRGVAEFGAAGLESAAGYVFDGDPNVKGDELLSGLTEIISKSWPKYEPKDPVAGVMADLTAAGGGIFGGAKLAAKAAQNMGAIKKGLTMFLGGEAGMTVAAGDEDTLLPFQLLGENPDGTFSENTLRRRMDFLADSIVTSGAIGVAGSVIGGGTRYVKNNIIDSIMNWRNLDARQKEFVETLTDMVSGVDVETATKEQIQEGRKKVQEFLSQNENTVVSLGLRDGEKEVTQDTVSVINSMPDVSESTKRSTEGLRSAALEGTSPRLQEALDAPTNELDDTFKALSETRGGQEAVQESGEQIIRSGVNEVSAYDDKVRQGRSNLLQAERGIEDRIKNDPNIGPTLEKLGNKVNISLSDAHTLPANELTEKLMQASKIMTDRKNQLYDAIPDGSMVDQDSFLDALEKAQSLGVIDDAMRAKLGEAGLDFKKLNTTAAFDIEPQIKRFRELQEHPKANALLDFKRHITDDQLDYLAKSGNEATKKAAEEARNYYIKDYKPFWRDNPILEEIQITSRSPSVFKTAEGRDTLTRQLDSGSIPEYTHNIIDLAARAEAGESQELLVDYSMGKMADRLRTTINRDGKLTPETVSEFTEYFNRYAPILDKIDPARRVQLEEFFTKIRDENFNVNELKDSLKTLEKNADEARDRVFQKELKEFFSDGKGVSNIQGSLKKLFNDPQSDNRIKQIIQRGKDNPVVLDGLQTGYLKEFQDKLFAGKDRSVAPIDWTTTDNKHFLDLGDELFQGDDRGVLEGLRQIADYAVSGERANITRGGGGLKTRGGQQQFQTAISTITTWMFGVLNPTAARVRTVSGDLMKEYNEFEIAKKAADIILSDRAAFKTVLDDVIKKGDGKLTPMQKRVLSQSAAKAGYIIDDDEGDLDPLDYQTEEALK